MRSSRGRHARRAPRTPFREAGDRASRASWQQSHRRANFVRSHRGLHLRRPLVKYAPVV